MSSPVYQKRAAGLLFERLSVIAGMPAFFNTLSGNPDILVIQL
jgi:hypothetical protein